MIHLEDECERLIDIEQSIKQEAKVLAFVDSWWEEATIVQRSCDPDRGIFFDRWWEEATFQQRSCDPDRGIFFDSWWEDATIVQRSCDPDRSPDQSNEIGNKPYHNKVRNVLNSLFGDKTEFPVLLWIIGLIFCSLLSPVRALDRPPLLAPDRCVQGTSVNESVIQSVEGSTATILFISAVNSVTTFNIKFLNEIIGPSNKYHITNETDGSHTVLSLIINNVSLEDAGIYQCYINNSQQSIDRNLSVSEFRWINKKKDVQAYVGEDARLEWKFRTSLCPDEVLVLKDTGNGLVQWRNGSVVHVLESRLCLNLTRNGSLITILQSIGNLTSEDLNSDYIVIVYFGSHAHIRSPVIYITGGSAVNSTSRPTTMNKGTSKENHNVTHPPPVVQDEHSAPWIIVIAVVLTVVFIVLIILIIQYRRKIRDNISK
ncbi:hypothetical protein SNE40_023590 [Patella caerulea]|uniref:Immunoglobulin-like beta-sandwich domain-containing protein n=1 Tax=Patella caerulea TaxID=87958 RepID=A0AAN8FVS0_PATCE